MPTSSLPGRVLKSTKEFASAIANEVVDKVPYSRSELVHATTHFAHWSLLRGLELERRSVFTELNINEFVAVALIDYQDSTRGNRRAQLRRIREVMDGELASGVPLKASDPLRPYTAREVTSLKRWAARQANPEFVIDAWSILALGLGVGLSAGEIGEVRRSDIRADANGTQVEVTGARKRMVQVRHEWEQHLIAGRLPPDAYLIRPNRKTNPRNLISNIVDRGEVSERGPQTQRMRATWLIHHMNASVALDVLVEAAGLQSLDGLTRYLPFVTTTKRSDARRLLRGSTATLA